MTMRKVNTHTLEEIPWSSPKGTDAGFDAGFGEEVSETLGRDPSSTDLMRRHPFDVEIMRVPPGKAPYVYHSHSAQREFCHVISGREKVRHQDGATAVEADLVVSMSSPTTPSTNPPMIPTATSSRSARPNDEIYVRKISTIGTAKSRKKAMPLASVATPSMFDWETENEPRIEIGWKWLTYSERGESFKIYIDPPTRPGKPFTFYLPGQERWKEVFPDWAAERRAEIVARIKEECAHFNAEWVEG